MNQFVGRASRDHFKPRQEHRCQLQIAARLLLEHGQEISFELRDLSTKGFSGDSSNVILINSGVALLLPDMEPIPAKVVWQIGGTTGGHFLAPLSVQQIISIAIRSQQCGRPVS